MWGRWRRRGAPSVRPWSFTRSASTCCCSTAARITSSTGDHRLVFDVVEKTSTCHWSRIPCIVAVKITTCRREDGGVVINKKRKKFMNFSQNSSDLLTDYSNNSHWNLTENERQTRLNVAVNDKLQSTAVMYWRYSGIVSNQINNGLSLSQPVKKNFNWWTLDTRAKRWIVSCAFFDLRHTKCTRQPRSCL